MDESKKIDLNKNNGGEGCSSERSPMNKMEEASGNENIRACSGAAPQFDQSQDVSVLYSVRNMDTQICFLSCGYVRFGPGQEKTEVSETHVIAYKVDRGNCSVTVQSVTKTLGVNCSFYTPLGSPYKIRNLSNTEDLILYFIQMSSRSSIN